MCVWAGGGFKELLLLVLLLFWCWKILRLGDYYYYLLPFCLKRQGLAPWKIYSWQVD